MSTERCVFVSLISAWVGMSFLTLMIENHRTLNYEHAYATVMAVFVIFSCYLPELGLGF